MTHPYALHVTVEVPCWCCLSPQPFRFTSATDQVVCTHCVNHLGSDKAERRDTEHVKLWASILDEVQQDSATFVAASLETDTANEATIATLTARVAELTAAIATDYAEAPAGGVRDALQNELLTRAERTTTLAYRRLDRVMAVIWRLAELHHDDPKRPQYCVCGTRTAQCAEGLALEPERQEMLAWEKKNLQLLQEGARHGLPNDHPAASTRR